MQAMRGDARFEFLKEILNSLKSKLFAPNTEILEVLPADTNRFIHSEYRMLSGAIRQYEVFNLYSFINYCKDRIDDETGAIFVSHEEIKGLHDIEKPNSSYVVYRFVKSQQFQDWLSVKHFNQRQLREFLETRLREFQPASLFEELAKLKLNAQIRYNADMDDDLNYRLIFEEKQAKGSSQIPKKITVSVPIYENRPARDVEFRVRFSQPKNDGEKPLFSLEPIGLEQILRMEMEDMAQTLDEELSGYEIYYGTPRYIMPS